MRTDSIIMRPSWSRTSEKTKSLSRRMTTLLLRPSTRTTRSTLRSTKEMSSCSQQDSLRKLTTPSSWTTERKDSMLLRSPLPEEESLRTRSMPTMSQKSRSDSLFQRQSSARLRPRSSWLERDSTSSRTRNWD